MEASLYSPAITMTRRVASRRLDTSQSIVFISNTTLTDANVQRRFYCTWHNGTEALSASRRTCIGIHTTTCLISTTTITIYKCMIAYRDTHTCTYICLLFSRVLQSINPHLVMQAIIGCLYVHR